MVGKIHPAYSRRNRGTVGIFITAATLAAGLAVIPPGYWLLAVFVCYAAAVFVIWPLIDEFRAAINFKALHSEFWIAAVSGLSLVALGTVFIFWHPQSTAVSSFIQNYGNGNGFNITIGAPPPAPIPRHLSDLNEKERKYFISIVNRTAAELSAFLVDRKLKQPPMPGSTMPEIIKYSNETMALYQQRFAADLASISATAAGLGWINQMERGGLDHPVNPLGIDEAARILFVLAGHVAAENENQK